jgi:hypothetical protein
MACPAQTQLLLQVAAAAVHRLTTLRQVVEVRVDSSTAFHLTQFNSPHRP